jgi:rRNA methylase
MGENIGAAARAMANFGLSDLRIVAPRDGWPNEKAEANAAKATHIIHAARVYDRLEDAIVDLSFVYATTARDRDVTKAVRGPVHAARHMRALEAQGAGVGLLFGRERWGLNNDEVALADEILTLPVVPEYASLNIAQAVLVVAYEWRKAGFEDPDSALPFAASDRSPRPARRSCSACSITWNRRWTNGTSSTRPKAPDDDPQSARHLPASAADAAGDPDAPRHHHLSRRQESSAEEADTRRRRGIGFR